MGSFDQLIKDGVEKRIGGIEVVASISLRGFCFLFLFDHLFDDGLVRVTYYYYYGMRERVMGHLFLLFFFTSVVLERAARM